MLGFLVGEALRDLRRAGRVAVSAVVLITLSLAALGGFWLVSSNLDRAVAKWRDRVRIVVYLKREPSAGDVAALLERVRVMPGVAGVVFIGKADALRGLKQVLGKDAGVVDQLPANPLPASLEVTPSAAAPELTIRLPVLLQGMMQGLAGAVLALAALVVTHSVGAPRLEPLVNLTLGISQLVFFTPVGVAALLGAGALLGGLGGWLARASREP